MMKKFLGFNSRNQSLFFVMILPFVFPLLTFAQERSRGTKELLIGIGKLVDLLIPGGMIFALIYFVFGMAIFIKNAGNEEGREVGKFKMKWGIISLFVIASIWGIVIFFQRELALPMSPGLMPVPNIYDL